jgi:hypothetical protein
VDIPPEVISYLGTFSWAIAVAGIIFLFTAWLGHFFGGWFERRNVS